MDRCRHHIPRQKFIHKTLSLFIEKDCSLSPDRLRNQETTSRLLRIKSRRMDLDIINMLHFDSMTQCDCQRISGNVTEIGRVLIKPSQSTTGKYRISCLYSSKRSICLPDHQSFAAILSTDNIQHHGMVQNRDIFSLLCSCQKLAGDLLSGNVLMKKNPGSGMASLSGKRQFISISLKIHTITDQILCNLIGRTDHNINGCFIVFIMTCFHCILKITVIILLASQHTHSSLCQKGVTLIHLVLCEHQYLILCRKLQSTKKSCCPCTYDHNICLSVHNNPHF